MSVRVYLRRHAKRPPNTELIRLGDTGITDEGKQSSRALGKSIRKSAGNKPVLFFTTDKPRTRDTAQAIMEGGSYPGKPRVMRHLTSLIRPSAKTLHREELIKLSVKTNDQILRDWIAGKISPDLLFSPEEEVAHTIRYWKKFQSKIKNVTNRKVHVEILTHDSTIAAFLYVFLNIKPNGTSKNTRDNPSSIGYLEALPISFGNRIELKFRGKKYDITEKFHAIANTLR